MLKETQTTLLMTHEKAFKPEAISLKVSNDKSFKNKVVS